ncbi:Uma2 family endonuclease [Nocardia mexicana]|uniref:Uma2 family endonuclease n=1 Tax=Nocardia mexicana TaxID=279262 RepID=A0A370H5Z7_9NOCA|nr:Uma2 family endonuclease [Nocardia mexicana]RDI51837.1 Uma2 family endonuclease [Nocardia mexicana]
MTALPDPRRLLTIADFVALPEDDQHRWELQEGVLVMSPSPTPRHNVADGRLFAQLDAQLPSDLVVVPDVDLDLELVPDGEPATVRRPDLVVVRRTEFERVDSDGGILRASGAVLVVEIISPGSRRTDTVTKPSEYAEAGIPHYWIVDTTPPVSLLAFRRTDELGFVDEGETSGTFRTASPCPLTIQVDRLR